MSVPCLAPLVVNVVLKRERMEAWTKWPLCANYATKNLPTTTALRASSITSQPNVLQLVWMLAFVRLVQRPNLHSTWCLVSEARWPSPRLTKQTPWLTGLQPTVDHSGWSKIRGCKRCYKSDPTYELPCRKTITKKIQYLYDDGKEENENLLEKVKYVALNLTTW